MHEEKPKVIYVMGTGRSGSTILGIALGNCADIFYAGELNLWLGRKGKSPLPGPERAQFWAAVRGEVAADVPGSGAPRLEARRLERSTDLLRFWDWPAQRRMRTRYRHLAAGLYRAIAGASGATHVVDTSHFPRRARQLQSVDGIDLYLLFLTRNPRDIVASYSEDDIVFPRFKTFNTNIYLWLTYLLSLLVFLRQPRERRLLVRYEGFIADPQSVLGEILERAGSRAGIPDFAALETGVAFYGNSILRSDVVALEKPPPPRRRRGSPATTILQLPWTALLSRLRPAAGLRRAPERAPSGSRSGS